MKSESPKFRTPSRLKSECGCSSTKVTASHLPLINAIRLRLHQSPALLPIASSSSLCLPNSPSTSLIAATVSLIQ